MQGPGVVIMCLSVFILQAKKEVMVKGEGVIGAEVRALVCGTEVRDHVGPWKKSAASAPPCDPQHAPLMREDPSGFLHLQLSV